MSALSVTAAWKEVDRIRTIAGDDEAAHSAEDSLRHAVLEAIATGDPDVDAVNLALAALATDDIVFERWCA